MISIDAKYLKDISEKYAFAAESEIAELAYKLETDQGVTATDILDLLESVERDQQKILLRLLRHFRDNEIVGKLVRWIPSNDVLLAQMAVQVLLDQESSEAHAALADYLPRASVMMAPFIIVSLGHANYRPATDAMIKIVQETPHDTIRYAAIEALGKLNAQKARSVIEQYVDHSNHHVNKRARMALEMLDSAKESN